jgi:hypothetical protein
MRTIDDEFELAGEDSGDEYGNWMLRKRRRSPFRWIIPLALVVLAGAGIYATLRVTSEQQNDAFCLGCHRSPEKTYYDRATTSIAGALAVDLASFHYQQIHGLGNTVRCIDCHQGNGSFGHRFDTLTLSADNTLKWLFSRDDPRTEKLRARVPYLSNDGCVGCHQDTLLVAGAENHHHNMLPVVYELWRSGGKLIAPEHATNKQAIIAAGLVRYESKLQCGDCHQSHRTIETDQYLDKKAVLPVKCGQCHREVGKGPVDVVVP